MGWDGVGYGKGIGVWKGGVGWVGWVGVRGIDGMG